MAWGESDYLGITPEQARAQWRSIMLRHVPAPGKRQVDFVPAETLLSLAASLIVNHRRFGSATAVKAPQPVPDLAALFSRPNSSILAKMANLDGSRRNGAKYDLLAGTALRDNPNLLSHVYRVVLNAARTEGLTSAVLPDFLGIEHGGDVLLIGQDGLRATDLENFLESELQQWHQKQPSLTERETERLMLSVARVGQSQFARGVLHNCARRCVFCGMGIPKDDSPRMLVAGHIKPWRDSSHAERLDVRNGLAACPTHDVAFDEGLLMVNGGLRIHLSQRLRDHVERDPAAKRFFDQPPLQQHLLLPAGALEPNSKYLQWHREMVYVA